MPVTTSPGKAEIPVIFKYLFLWAKSIFKFLRFSTVQPSVEPRIRFVIDVSKLFRASETTPSAAVTISKLYITVTSVTSDPDVSPNDPSPLLAHPECVEIHQFD